MPADLALAALHHLLVFALTASIAAEAVLLHLPMDATSIARLAKIDACYGASAGLLLVVGLCRIWLGTKGPEFYLHNPWMHAKLGGFVLVGVLSILPTLRYLRWRGLARANPQFRPAASELDRMRRFLHLQLLLLATLFMLAAAMARYGGF